MLLNPVDGVVKPLASTKLHSFAQAATPFVSAAQVDTVAGAGPGGAGVGGAGVGEAGVGAGGEGVGFGFGGEGVGGAGVVHFAAHAPLFG
jgi:hypothetical protein